MQTLLGAGAATAGETPLGGVRTLEPVWIEVSGGLRLSARLWLPADAQTKPAPVVLEYIPYRTRDSYRAVDDHWGPQLAARGIAFARVDIRGSGDSEGLLLDEYLASEQQDAVEVIAWLARQPWCNGNVGMRGISWGGFATLQVAALRPPALKAIMPMCATDMRFAEDAHYIGGAPGLTNLKWAAGFEAVMAGPPDPSVTGPAWMDLWLKRLRSTPSIAARWLSHDSNDEYWRHGSVGLDYDAIECPVYLVDGWADSYVSSALRLLGGLRAPRKAIIGPWGHIYPDLASPGPGLDWAFEEARWWRHWLMGEDNGVMDGPMLRFYLPYATPAQTGMAEIPGHWAAESAWPSTGIEPKRLYLAPGALADRAPPPSRLTYVGDKPVGLANPEWIPYAKAELAKDQAEDDARSLVFDWPPLKDGLEIVGFPIVSLRLSSNRPLAKVAVRLCEVTPDGKSWLVTYGLLDLAFRAGLTEPPAPMVPGETFDVDLPLNATARRFKAGSTIRLAISESLWPLVWPSPEIATLDFDLGAACLTLPVRPPPSAEAPFPIPLTHFGFSRGNPTLVIEGPDARGHIHVDGAWPDSSSKVAGVGTTISGGGPDMTLDYDPADPSSCVWRVSQTSRFKRGDWDAETRVTIEMTADTAAYTIKDTLIGLKDGEVVFERRSSDLIPRRFS
jgi:putative CocE/NonD family hydrolase